MNAIKYFYSAFLMLVVFAACNKVKTDDVSFVDAAAAPAKLSVMFDITQDNSGLVTITPNGEGAIYYDVYYGDATATPANLSAGKNTTHIYAEGVYNVKIVAHAVNGKTTELIQKLTVSFRAPENLAVTVAIDGANNFKVNVSATALYETFFKVFWGDVANEPGQSFLEGQTVSHVYAAVGTYTVKVVAYSGGVATTTYTTTVTIVDPVLLPITFESATINYAFTNFGGATATKIANPQNNGINTSANVGRMVKNAPEVWAGSFLTLGGPIDFSANKVFRMKVFSPRVGAKVLLKTENLTNGGIFFEKEVLTTVANTWEDLAFDFRTINTGNSYSKVVLIFDNGTVGDGTANFTWLFDDIRLTNQMPVSLLALPVTFDLPGVNYEVTDFGNNQSSAAVDPTNGANNVKKTIKANGAETWAGTTIGAGFTTNLPFTATKTQMSVRVYSPAAGIRVRLKVEDRTNNTRSVETEAMTQAANTWETLVFDFANQSSGTAGLNLAYTYNMASIFFDFGNVGTGKVFYWDDVNFLANNVIPNYLALPIDFQSTTYPYPFIDFGGATASVVNNPNASGINTSTKVGKMVKGAPEVWAGSFLELVNPINFSVLKTFKVKVYSPRIGARLLLKVENATNGGISFEKEATCTTANAWEELTFDFSTINVGNSYSKVVLIFDLGNVGDGSANYTFYFDDIRLN
ncbi:MAG: hypothetical protein IPP96_11860 [Chitinophagaceae bacterium]|nr:hypothetical protein [Chitinophagaceae bacterium]